MFFIQENRIIVDGDCLIGTAVECIQGKHYHLKTQTLLTFTSKSVHQKRKCGYSLNCLFSIFTMFDWQAAQADAKDGKKSRWSFRCKKSMRILKQWAALHTYMR